MAYFSIPQLWAVISSAYIETGIYITEQERFSYYTGATLRLVIINTIFYASLFIFLNYRLGKHSAKSKFNGTGLLQVKVRDSQSAKTLIYSFLTILFLAISYLYLDLFRNGVIPLLNMGEVSRFNYWTDYNSNRLAGKIYGYSYPIAFMLGFLFMRLKLMRVSRLVSVMPMILLIYLLGYFILLGNKFSILYLSIFAFLMPLLVNKQTAIKVNKRQLIIFGSLLISLVFLFLVLSYYQYSLVSDTPFQVIMYRTFGLQGHMWWGIDNLLTSISVDHYSHFVSEIEEILNPTALHINTGIRFLMILLDPRVAWIYITNGVNFTMAYPAIAVYTFGYLGAGLFQIVFALLTGLLIRWNIGLIEQGRVISATVVFKFLFAIYYILTMGELSALLYIKNLAYVLLVLVISLVHKVNSSAIHIKK